MDCRNSSFKNIWAYLTQAFSRCLVLCSVMGSCGSRSWSKPLTGNPTLMAPCYHSFCCDVFSIIRLLILRIRLLWLVYRRIHTGSSDVRGGSGRQNVNGWGCLFWQDPIKLLSSFQTDPLGCICKYNALCSSSKSPWNGQFFWNIVVFIINFHTHHLKK